ncbi:unnamed protein product, partial [Polarella glacialis]
AMPTTPSSVEGNSASSRRRPSVTSEVSLVSDPRNSEGSTEAVDGEGERCSLCEARLGKRRLNPRHHCRICNRCVCAACSPGSVPLKGVSGLHRACSACLSGLGGNEDLSRRAGRICNHLQSLSSIGVLALSR